VLVRVARVARHRARPAPQAARTSLVVVVAAAAPMASLGPGFRERLRVVGQAAQAATTTVASLVLGGAAPVDGALQSQAAVISAL
jgi:hypothetical protein